MAIADVLPTSAIRTESTILMVAIETIAATGPAKNAVEKVRPPRLRAASPIAAAASGVAS
jgi:hypothetical protein